MAAAFDPIIFAPKAQTTFASALVRPPPQPNYLPFGWRRPMRLIVREVPITVASKVGVA
jgi:hypothetical protein